MQSVISRFYVQLQHRNRFLTWVALIDGAVYKGVPKSLRAQLLYQSHFKTLAGHPGEIRIYDTMRRDYYWPHTEFDTTLHRGLFRARLEQAIWEAQTPMTVISCKLRVGTRRNGHAGKTAEDVQRKSIFICDEKLLLKANESRIDVYDEGCAHCIDAYGSLDYSVPNNRLCAEGQRSTVN